MMKNISFFILNLFFVAFASFAQQKTAVKNCPCTIPSEISEWKPQLIKGYDTSAYANNFANSVNGVYIAEDRDSLYQIKIIVDAKSYANFVHFQHLSFSKARLINKHITRCEELPNVHDGGWIGQNIFTPVKAINRQIVASSFFVGENYLRVDKTRFYRLYKCDKESKFGIHDADRQRYYRKVYWKPEGQFTEISPFGFTQKEVKKYNKQQLAEMRNEVYARYNFAFKDGSKWYNHFNNKPDYRWNHFKDVTPFLTQVEKENIKYITAFESADYYDNQFQNDFLTFWEELRKSVLEQNQQQLQSLVQFPFEIDGDLDNMPILKLNSQQFEKIWPLLLQQENYGIDEKGKPVSFLGKSVFNKDDAFTEQMINTRSNSMANFNFEKVNAVWKLNGAYADNELYPKIQNLLNTK
ncbi:YARHG domain-containing protein [Pedobacter lithocola]|uniref:YARHG domain-containing protein n=1 Tax=Pedobacter lithocola TaxID=1908239 RepID=A0ABV8PB07_9SPHI